MATTYLDLTVGDTGITISGPITQRGLGDLSDASACSVKFSLLPLGGGVPIIDEAVGAIGTFDQATNTVNVSYRLRTEDVANPAQGTVRWTFILPDGGEIHAPGRRKDQTIVRINA